MSLAAGARGGPAPLVALSGIDASGKGAVARALGRDLRERGLAVAHVGIDPWHAPPEVRFSAQDPGGHFYAHAIRFGALFSQLVEPLRTRRSLDATFELMDGYGAERRPLRYAFERVDVVLLEGIFLLRRDLRRRYDLALWVECSFETALSRALARNQEGLTPERLAEDYRTIYFPAQRVHFERDAPRDAAHVVIPNGA